ncbi:lysine-ketoglutarate reductase/saccharopine dehydrogenase bifunctional enzyme [Artemisia annua]|uniref:Lysine-ketoglutarate reductase/saccharopine dehydrogenase bifunctional enzyme n=1 Tax=Artemisia annua TaxID=35608 RepID=A0A2U1Q390_ARTAN|nr:lysine-ketoglutarate reductase/saccharopine dehydrogenase bifunctional enzyme [Artemisia annua]
MGGFWTYYVLLKKMQGHVFKLGEVLVSCLLETRKRWSKHCHNIVNKLTNYPFMLMKTIKLYEALHLRRACIAHGGALASLYEYILRMRNSHYCTTLVVLDLDALRVSISGHLFGQFLIKEALDIIEAAGCSFHLVKWVKDEMCCLQE